ncbi:MAG: zinc ribbon domain-containing protein [Bacteroidaceae bacterium]|nr:zinc ribbon domain-containing protein [Bacteroidaceae bacterium]
MQTEQRSQLLIFADEDIINGMKYGYYGELETRVNRGEIKIANISDVEKYPINPQTKPNGNGADIYVWNAYDCRYESLFDTDIVNIFVKGKSQAVRVVLEMMGAKHIILKSSKGFEEKSLKEGEMNVKVPLKAKVSVNGKIANQLNVNIKEVIETINYNESPKKYDKIRSYMIIHGLMDDRLLSFYLEQFKNNGVLHKKEKYILTYLSEVQSAINILSNMQCKIFSGNIDFSAETTYVSTQTESLEIDFGTIFKCEECGNEFVGLTPGWEEDALRQCPSCNTNRAYPKGMNNIKENLKGNLSDANRTLQ